VTNESAESNQSIEAAFAAEACLLAPLLAALSGSTFAGARRW
jgi:hypothetical protein